MDVVIVNIGGFIVLINYYRQICGLIKNLLDEDGRGAGGGPNPTKE